jgi:Rad3-related DNA helicase
MDIAPKVLWPLGKKWLLMSATVISGQEMLESLGWTGDYAIVNVPSTFPAENRKVIYHPVANMARKTGEESRQHVGDAIAEIIARHSTDRVLVHTVSYDLATTIQRCIIRSGLARGRDIFSYTAANGRSDSLNRFMAQEGSILIAPSLDRGIDLPDDMCRVQIIAKVPYPYLGDRQVNARLHSKGGQTWYTVQTIRTIIQMCGRAVRHEDDWAVTYILDEQFGGSLWSKGRGLFPKWFMEGMVWEDKMTRQQDKTR